MATNAGEVRITLKATTTEIKAAFKQVLGLIRSLRKEANALQASLSLKPNVALVGPFKRATTEVKKTKVAVKGVKQELNAAGMTRPFAGLVASAKRFAASVRAASDRVSQFAARLRNLARRAPFLRVARNADTASKRINTANKSVTLLIAKFALLVFAAQTLARIIDSTFGAALRTVDEFRISTIESAVGLTRIADLSKVAGSTLRSAFEQNLKFVQGVFIELEVAAQDFFATGSELQEGFNILSQQGIVIRREEIDLLGQVVDSIKLSTRGIQAQGQIAQEVRQLLEGQVNRTTQLGLALQRAGADAGELAKQIRETGTLEPLRPFVEAIGVASQEIRQTLTSALATTQTLLQQITRFAIENIFDDIVNDVQRFNQFLADSRIVIAAIANVALRKIRDQVRDILGRFTGVGDTAQQLAVRSLPLLLAGFEVVKDVIEVIARLLILAGIGTALLIQKLREFTDLDLGAELENTAKKARDLFLDLAIPSLLRPKERFSAVDVEKTKEDAKDTESIFKGLIDNLKALADKGLTTLGLKGTVSEILGLDPDSPDVAAKIKEITATFKELAEALAFPATDRTTAAQIEARRAQIQGEVNLLELRSQIAQEKINNDLAAREEGLQKESRALEQSIANELLTTQEAATQRDLIEKRLIATRVVAQQQLAQEEASLNVKRLAALREELRIEKNSEEKLELERAIKELILKTKLDEIKAKEAVTDEQRNFNELNDENLLSQTKFNRELREQLRLLKQAATVRPLGTTEDEAARQQVLNKIENQIIEARRRASTTGNVLSPELEGEIREANIQAFERKQFETEIRELAQSIRSTFANIVTSLAQGTLDLRSALQSLSGTLINQGLRGLFDSLQAGLEKLFTDLGTVASKQAAQALAASIGLLLAVLSRVGTDATFTPGAGGGGQVVESTQAVRGIIGGDTQIAIAEINNGLQEALIPTNNILATIERNTRSLAELNLNVDPDQLAQGIQDQIGDILSQALLQVTP